MEEALEFLEMFACDHLPENLQQLRDHTIDAIAKLTYQYSTIIFLILFDTSSEQRDLKVLPTVLQVCSFHAAYVLTLNIFSKSIAISLHQPKGSISPRIGAPQLLQDLACLTTFKHWKKAILILCYSR